MRKRPMLTIALLVMAGVGTLTPSPGPGSFVRAAGPGNTPTCGKMPAGKTASEMGDMEGQDEPLVVGASSKAGDLSTQGGFVVLNTAAEAGHIRTKSGAVVVGNMGSAASITTEGGSIELCTGGQVAGNVETASGSIVLGPKAEIAGRIVVRKPAVLPATPPVIRLGTAATVSGVELGYPVRICYGTMSSAGRVTGAKPLPCP